MQKHTNHTVRNLYFIQYNIFMYKMTSYTITITIMNKQTDMGKYVNLQANIVCRQIRQNIWTFLTDTKCQKDVDKK